MRWRAQLRRAALLLGGVAVPFAWLLALPAGAQPPAAPPHTITVPDAAEAWYAASPVDPCTTPIGCTPNQVPTSPYPADTLHVGVAGGQETARSYLLPDLVSLPVGAQILSATMTVPVATGNTDGTASPGAARMIACLVTQPFPDGTQGSSSAPPKVDCSAADKATYDAKRSTFTVDLAAIANAWRAGAPPLGIALLPDVNTSQPTDAWHVTIDGRKRAASPHVQTKVTYVAPPPTAVGSGSAGSTTSTPASTRSNAAAPPAVTPPSVSAPSSNTSVTPPVSPPMVASPQQPKTFAQQPVAFRFGVPQPVAFVVPLLLLAGAVFFARVFTRDATPMTVRS